MNFMQSVTSDWWQFKIFLICWGLSFCIINHKFARAFYFIFYKLLPIRKKLLSDIAFIYLINVLNASKADYQKNVTTIFMQYSPLQTYFYVFTYKFNTQ